MCATKAVKPYLFTTCKVVLFCATPFKSLASFRHYFAISAQLNSGNNQPQNKLYRRQFHLFSSIQLYFVALNLFRFALPLCPPIPLSTPLIKDDLFSLLTFDIVHHFHLPHCFYLLYGVHAALVLYYIYLFYLCPSVTLNAHLKRVLLCLKNDKLWFHRKSCPHSTQIYATNSTTDETLRSFATLVLNGLEAFIILIDVGIAFGTASLTHKLLCSKHIIAYALIYVLILMGTQGFMCIVYMHRYVRRNTGQIRKSIYQKNASFLLCRLLRENIVIFQLLFSGSATFGNVFLAFQLFNLPANALFTILIMFGKRMEHFTLYVVVAFASHELLGTVLMHVAIARLSQHLHSGGVHLVAFSASVSAGVCGGDDSKGGQQTVWKSKVRDCLALKQKLAIWRHTMRLVTGNRYCFTYGLIGAPVTMRTFTKCTLFYGKLCMYSYSLVKYHNHSG